MSGVKDDGAKCVLEKLGLQVEVAAGAAKCMPRLATEEPALQEGAN